MVGLARWGALTVCTQLAFVYVKQSTDRKKCTPEPYKNIEFFMCMVQLYIDVAVTILLNSLTHFLFLQVRMQFFFNHVLTF